MSEATPPRSTLPRRPLAWLRRRLRSSEIWFIALAVVVGAAAGLLSVFQDLIAHRLQSHLYGFAIDDRLSALPRISPIALLWLPAGGLVLGGLTWVMAKWRPLQLIDVVEANALYGGVLSFRDSFVVCVQTLISNGFGASVGLEAAYAQGGGAIASGLGQRLKLRRQDLRTLVGAGSGAAIGAAFGAPLTGAFYAFEIVIGSYAPSMIAPVAAAALASVLVARLMGAAPYSIQIVVFEAPRAFDYLLYAGLGVVCAVVGIAIMRLVGTAERLVRLTPIPTWMRPAVGGGLLAGLAYLSPQTLSSGHGALHADLATSLGLGALAAILLLKTGASVISLGFGFRGGLFFASLFLGSLVGQIYARLVEITGLPLLLQPENAALVGMGALAVAIVGGPLTMSFLVLETTRDFGVSAATLAASLIASTVVRERFGYSFSTWRLHLRGETIRSARDVGWIRTLTAGRMMRADTATIAASATLAEFRRRFPLGSTSRVILLDDAQRYAGIVVTSSAYLEGPGDDSPVSTLATGADVVLSADMNIEQVMQTFDRTETEELAVTDDSGQVLGLLAEVYVARRYAKELEKVQQGLFGEG
ncbi:chloride channel protein [Phenylobacterium sp.]|uniref:chloride channel protein n=1 Tax=Phenylobacterium sp. TaxID=1871053 RepID=UPI00286B9A7C|nr:chloride channel protein [Phenylobacterium sp.]